MGPRFYVALAHTDNFAVDSAGDGAERISLTHLLPEKLNEHLLFSLSFDSRIHYRAISSHSMLHHSLTPPKPLGMFADCGAYQYRKLDKPIHEDGTDVSADSVWGVYLDRHVNSDYAWEEILLCAPDHIVTKDMSNSDTMQRLKFTQEHAGRFLELARPYTHVHPVGVIHGRTNKERMEQYIFFKELGYTHVALGGMVPYSRYQRQVLDIVAGIEDLDAPLIAKNSILGQCKHDGIKLHVFGLNGPDYIRWWTRLGVDSFDGAKLSLEGAANGWYYQKNEAFDPTNPNCQPPTSANDLFTKQPVSKFGAKDWNWLGKDGWIVHHDPRQCFPPCTCPACSALMSLPCTSKRCWLHQDYPDHKHVADPRMMGSTEHNMGRVAHNAHVYADVISEIQNLVMLADQSDQQQEHTWHQHWRTVEVDS